MQIKCGGDGGGDYFELLKTYPYYLCPKACAYTTQRHYATLPDERSVPRYYPDLKIIKRTMRAETILNMGMSFPISYLEGKKC